jgi:hypothetical protein
LKQKGRGCTFWVAFLCNLSFAIKRKLRQNKKKKSRLWGKPNKGEQLKKVTKVTKVTSD